MASKLDSPMLFFFNGRLGFEASIDRVEDSHHGLDFREPLLVFFMGNIKVWYLPWFEPSACAPNWKDEARVTAKIYDHQVVNGGVSFSPSAT